MPSQVSAIRSATWQPASLCSEGRGRAHRWWVQLLQCCSVPFPGHEAHMSVLEGQEAHVSVLEGQEAHMSVLEGQEAHMSVLEGGEQAG
jgi:hypothetical protein